MNFDIKYTTEWITDSKQFISLRSDWGDLLDHSNAGLFSSWEWLYPWYRHIAPSRELRILVIRNSTGMLCGLLPLSIREETSLFGKVRYLCFLGDQNVGSDYLDIIIRNGSDLEIIKSAKKALVEIEDQWDVLELIGVLENASIYEILKDFTKDHQVSTTLAEVCPYEAISPGDSFDCYFQKQRRYQEYHSKVKKFSNKPGYRITRQSIQNEAKEGLEIFFKLHATRWNPAGGSAAIISESLVEFHREAVGYLSEGNKVCFYTLESKGQPAASVYVLRHGGRTMYYQTGMDPSAGAISPGFLLLVEALKDCWEGGGSEFDFLRGDEPYKGDWAHFRRKIMTTTIYPLKGKGRLILESKRVKHATRSSIKKVVPDAILRQRHEMTKKIKSFFHSSK